MLLIHVSSVRRNGTPAECPARPGSFILETNSFRRNLIRIQHERLVNDFRLKGNSVRCGSVPEDSYVSFADLIPQSRPFRKICPAGRLTVGYQIQPPVPWTMPPGEHRPNPSIVVSFAYASRQGGHLMLVTVEQVVGRRFGMQQHSVFPIRHQSRDALQSLPFPKPSSAMPVNADHNGRSFI